MEFGFPVLELCLLSRIDTPIRNLIENGEIDDLIVMHKIKAVCAQSCTVYHGNKLTCLTSTKSNQNKNVIRAQPHLAHSPISRIAPPPNRSLIFRFPMGLYARLYSITQKYHNETSTTRVLDNHRVVIENPCFIRVFLCTNMAYCADL